jgi:choline dehydrogenase-like flavoprotein
MRACLNSNLVLLNSTSSRFPNGLGNDNGLLGKFVAFHNYRGTVTSTFEGYEDSYYYGRRPTAIMLPSFRNVRKQEEDFMRGYMSFYSASRANGMSESIGAELKESVAKPGIWHVNMMMQGETIPIESNHLRLSTDQKDPWGIPQLITSIEHTENDEKVKNDFLEQAQEMLDKAGCKNIVPHDSKQAPGLDIHEMGGVRMGRDPKTSLLNKWNQFHACKNVFVNRWRLHDEHGQSKSIAYVYGINGSGSKLCGRGSEEGKLVALVILRLNPGLNYGPYPVSYYFFSIF